MPELSDYKKQLDTMFEKNQAQLTTAEEQTANLNEQSQAAYRQKQLEDQKAQNQFYKNQAANQASALDAIRKSNASAIANGANAGISAANELSAILGLQEESSKEATELANKAITDAAELNTQLNANATEGQKLANELNATISANNSELAKSIAALAEADTNEKVNAVKPVTDEQGNVVKDAQGNVQYTSAVSKQLNLQEQADANALDSATYTGIVDNIKDVIQQTKESREPINDFTNPTNGQSYKAGDEAHYINTLQDLQNTIALAYASKDVNNYKKAVKLYTDFVKDNPTQERPCVVPGTLIRMADGTDKVVENIQPNDKLLVWDIFKGEFETAPVLFTENRKEDKRTVIKLTFSDNTTVEMVYDHGFFDAKLKKYVYIHNLKEAKKYLKHTFLKYDTVTKTHVKVKLIKVSSEIRVTTTHSPCTARHLCLYVNGILSMPGATESFTNIFKVNKNYHYDHKNMAKMLNKYGMFTPKDFAELIPESIFYAFQGEFLKVKMGKKETSMEEIKALIQKYSIYF